MQTHRKIQVAAAVVAANAIAALQLMTPNVAMAASCTPGGHFFCDYSGACWAGDAVTACTTHAPPGCTNIQGLCLDGDLCDPSFPALRVICSWQ
jgi:hypothetical protein